MSLYIDKEYESKENTPLKWHNFSRYFRAPVGVLYGIYSIVVINGQAGYNYLLIFVDIMVLISIIFQVLYFIGSFNWKKYAYNSIVISKIYSVIYSFCLTSLAYQNAAKSIGAVLGTGTVCYFEFVYYKKRKKLFDNNKFNAKEDNMANADESAYCTNDISDIKYCRKCGTKLDEGSLYCKKCGTRVGN